MERSVLEQNLMFYGFLRFSLRFAFYTMPKEHPIMTAILADLSKLHEREVRKLVGYKPDDPVPLDSLASLYHLRNGRLEKLSLGRINPGSSAITGGDHATQIISGLAPPPITWLGEQATASNWYTGKPWRLSTADTNEPIQGPTDARLAMDAPGVWGARGRILLNSMLGMPAPVRALMRAGRSGESTYTDSLPWSERPVRWKDPDAQEASERGRKMTSAQPQWERGIRPLTDPFYSAISGRWVPSDEKNYAKYAHEVRQRQLGKGKRKKKGSSGGWTPSKGGGV